MRFFRTIITLLGAALLGGIAILSDEKIELLGYSAQQQSKPKPKCNPNVVDCPPPSATPRPIPKATASSPIVERNPELISILYDQDKDGTVEWKNKRTGAIKQSDGKFTLYNEYTFDAKKTDRFVLRLNPSGPPWEIQLIEAGSRSTIATKPANAPGEFRLENSLPRDGKYRILVRYSGLDAKATRFSAIYTLRVATGMATRTPTQIPTPTIAPYPVCQENLKNGEWAKARTNCRRALDLRKAVVFDIKTSKRCSDRINLNNPSELNNLPLRQLEIQGGRIEIRENGNPARDCLAPEILNGTARITVSMQLGTIVVEIKEEQGKIYRLLPASKTHEESELIRQLIDAHVVRRRP